MVVITTASVRAGTRFGPVPQSLFVSDVIEQLAASLLRRPPLEAREREVHVDLSDDQVACLRPYGLFDWAPFLRAARSDAEQNLSLFVHQGFVLYTAIRDIPAESELFVWFSRETIRDLHIQVPSHSVRAMCSLKGPFTCERCGECMELANAMACHTAFVCKSSSKRKKSPPPVAVPAKHRRSCKKSESADATAAFALPSTASAASSESLLSPRPDPKQPAVGDSWGGSEESASQSEALNLILGLYKSANPVVDAVLRSVASNCSLAAASSSIANSIAAASTASGAAHMQNWCARCGTVFRMTGDLVHHIRGHHREDAIDTAALSAEEEALPSQPKKTTRGDQMPSQVGNASREEKLRCNICGERFRERHHLSRHLSSH